MTTPSVPATAVVPGVVLPSTIFNSVAVDDTDTPPICKVVVFNVVVVAVPDTCNVVDGDTVDNVTSLCKSFDSDIVLDYVGVVRWPVGTFMKPHFDKNDVHGEDVFAAMLYLNDDFDGGSTIFEHMEVKPETGKLIIFSNSQYLHHVSKVDTNERYVLSFWYKYPKPV